MVDELDNNCRSMVASFIEIQAQRKADACDFSLQDMLETELSYAELIGSIFNASNPALTIGENILVSLSGTTILHLPRR